jgi:uncharacterized protein YbjT (DUF2867 family)
MRVLITGASGFIGSQIAAALRAGDHAVVAADRRHGVDFNRMRACEDWQPLLAGVDAVVNCVGIIGERRHQRFAVLHREAPAALFRACVAAGVRRVVQISALGADERSFTPYQRSKLAADDVLRGLPLEWFVLRPSLVYGKGGASTAMFKRLAALPLIPLVGGGAQRVQPVHIDDLVAAVLVALAAERACRTIDVVGPEAMTFKDWLQRLRMSAGKSAAATLSVPRALMTAVAQLARHVTPVLHPDNLAMLEQGNTADVEPFARFLERMPRAVP